jgi:hypothetical protein
MQRSSKEEYFKRVARSANAPSITVGKDSSKPHATEPEITSDSVAGDARQLQDRALRASYINLARLILKTLTDPDRRTVFDLLSPLDTSTEQLLPIIRRMEEERLVKVDERDRTGNWKLEPTEFGLELLR